MRLHHQILLTLSLTLLAPAWAEDLYFRSSKVDALTRGSQSTLEVELMPLLKALGYSSQEVQGVVYLFDSPTPGTANTQQAPNGATVVFGEKSVEASTDEQGHLLVNLTSFCAATGLRERRSGNRAELSKPLARANAEPSVELISNPSFSSGLTGWTVVGKCESIEVPNSNGIGKKKVARLEDKSSLFQDLITVPGKNYEVRIDYYGLNPSRIIELKIDSQSIEKLPGGDNLSKSIMFRGSSKGKTRVELRGASTDHHFVILHSVRVRPVEP